MILNTLTQQSFYLSRYEKEINSTLKEIEQDGISYKGFEGVINTIDKLKITDELNFSTQLKRSISSSQLISNEADNALQSINSNLENYRTLLIRKNTDSLSELEKNLVDVELNSLKQNIENIENQKLKDNESLFGIKSEIVTGNKQREVRSYGSELISINDNKISELLENSDIEKLDFLLNKVNISLVTVGTHANRLEDLYNSNELKQVNLTESFENKKDLTGTFLKLEGLQLGYEASAMIVNKIKGLSLVNYL